MNFENGMYIKGEIRAVKIREVRSKDRGDLMVFHSVIVEDDPARPKMELQLSRDAVNSGLYGKLQGLVGRIVMIPCYVSVKNSFVNWHYSGTNLPIMLDRPEPQQQKAS